MRARLHLSAWTVLIAAITPAAAGPRWTEGRANAWYAAQPALAGANFMPSTAVNQLEMWQAETFDPATIDRELGWAERLGFNTMRVFLHDLVWTHDREGFLRRIDRFLDIAERHRMRVMLVIFDGVWDPHPRIGRQRAPRPHVHNSGWVQSPGVEILRDPHRRDALAEYVRGVVRRFANDRRVLAWDLFNEPDNPNQRSYGAVEAPDKAELALALLARTFAWAREVAPSQPLTAGVWRGDWSDGARLSPINRFMLEQSDVVSFHSYAPLDVLRARVESLRRHGRPLLCSEYMNRQAGSLFDPNLGYLRRQRVAAYHWGLVAGKTQTIYPWDSWEKTYTAAPVPWFHDVFRPDGTPFDAREVSYIKRVLAAR